MRHRVGLGEGLMRLRERYSAAPMMPVMLPVVDEAGRPHGQIYLQSLSRFTTLDFAVSPRSALIIGAAGFIGSVLARKLIAGGWSVTVRNIDTMVEAASGVDASIYLANLVDDPAVSMAPQMVLETNYLASTARAHLCAYLNVNRFVYTASCSVYRASANLDAFLDKRSPTAPLSLYRKMKLMVEEAILATTRQPNPLFAPTILRLGMVFGLSHRSRFDLVDNVLVKEACKQGRIRLFGVDQWRPQVPVRDLARAILQVLEAPLDRVWAETLNVSNTGQNHTIAELGIFAAEVFPGLQVIREAGATDPRSYRMSCDKIRDGFGFHTEISVPVV